MALVAYDDSDLSDQEENTKFGVKDDKVISELTETNNAETLIFNKLPQPESKKVIEEDDEFLHKKEQISEVPKPTKTRISIPLLSEFKDIDDITQKQKSGNKKVSGLLSILPKPKNSHSYVCEQKNTIKKSMITSSALTPTVLKKKSIEKQKLLIESENNSKSIIISSNYNDDSDDELMEKNDFFSFHSATVELGPNEPESTLDNEIETRSSPETTVHNESSERQTDEKPNQSNKLEAVSLDDEALRKLCGSRGRRRLEDIQIIDVSQEAILGNTRELLLKGLTDDTSKRLSASKRKGNEPTSQQKRKHHITYLAHQAKANEAELQNQWATNRLTKRQTQSKYGF